MRNKIKAVALGSVSAAVALSVVLAPAAQAAQEPKNHQRPQDAKKIRTWDRVWFRGAGPVGGTDIVQPFTPPTAREMHRTAPAATALGVLNIGWFVGDFPALPAIPPFIPRPTPPIPDVNVPGDFRRHGYKTYIWYSTVTGGDDADGAPDLFGLIPVPGWDRVTDIGPPNWIATDETAQYADWARGRGSDAPMMVAHRGGGEVGQDVSRFPENSLAAFRRAIRDGAAVLETDVQWTKRLPGDKTGTPVLMHDETINRTATCKPTARHCVDPVYPITDSSQAIKVSSLTKKQLNRYQLSNGENIPTFHAYLTLANRNRVGVLPEIKNWKRQAPQLRPELRQYTHLVLAKKRIPTVIIGSFDPTILQYFKNQGFLAKQRQSCASLPKRLKKNHRYVIRSHSCTTNAGSVVRVYLDAKKRVATFRHRAHGKVVLTVKNCGGRVRLDIKARNQRGYEVYRVHRTYQVG